MHKLPISAMIAGRNEGHFLKSCLESVSFCNEILYADLESSDNSIEIARGFNCRVFKKALVPSGEYIHAELVKETIHDWVIFIDPDEVVDESLQQQIISEFEALTSNAEVGGILVPWVFYFKKHLLKGTIWGGVNQKFFLVNKHRFDFLPITHYGRKLKDGFESKAINLNENRDNVLHHYWMNSYKIFIAKHKRYLKKEGIDVFNLGMRHSVKTVCLTPFREFSLSYFTKKGYKDKLIGIYLSIFWASYKTRIACDVWRLTIDAKKNQ